MLLGDGSSLVVPRRGPCAVQDAGGANEGATAYAHDANGNLVKQTDAMGRKVKFAYDALNRRASA